MRGYMGPVAHFAYVNFGKRSHQRCLARVGVRDQDELDLSRCFVHLACPEVTKPPSMSLFRTSGVIKLTITDGTLCMSQNWRHKAIRSRTLPSPPAWDPMRST